MLTSMLTKHRLDAIKIAIGIASKLDRMTNQQDDSIESAKLSELERMPNNAVCSDFSPLPLKI